MHFIGNSATEESVWILTSDEPIPSEGLTGDDVVIDFIETFDTTIVSDPTDTMDELKQARKRKMKKVKRRHLRGQKNICKGNAWSHLWRLPNP